MFGVSNAEVKVLESAASDTKCAHELLGVAPDAINTERSDIAREVVASLQRADERGTLSTGFDVHSRVQKRCTDACKQPAGQHGSASRHGGPRE